MVNLTPKFMVRCSVVQAKNLPKTDRFSSIDPYFVICHNGVDIHKTKAKDNDVYPIWGLEHPGIVETDVNMEEQKPRGVFTFKLYDKGMRKDKHIATAKVDLSEAQWNRQSLLWADLELKPEESKWQKDGMSCTVSISWMFTFDTLQETYTNAHNMGSLPYLYSHPQKKRLYVPCMQSGPNAPVCMGIEYERDCIDVKFYTIDPSATSSLFIDMVNDDEEMNDMIHRCANLIRRRQGKPEKKREDKASKLRRRQYDVTPQHIECFDKERQPFRLPVFAEIKMDDVMIGTKFELISVLFFVSQLRFSLGMDEVVKNCGWAGAMSWQQCRKKLINCAFDDPKEEIWMELPGHQDAPCRAIVDYDPDGCDIKIAVLQNAAGAHNVTYDLTIRNPVVKKTTLVYKPARTKCAGKYPVVREVELDDVPFGTQFRDMTVTEYSIQLHQTVPLSQIAVFY
eukprot:Clim_evm1s5 gene=Clim_evmTU1s5